MIAANSSLKSNNSNNNNSNNLRWLYLGRLVRSFVTSFLTVIFPVYLANLGYGAALVGVVLTVVTAASAFLVVMVGLGSDRLGAKPMLLGLAVLSILGAAAVGLSPSLVVIMLAGGLGGIGRGGAAGSGGAWGPFFPAEQKLLAESSEDKVRTKAFGTIGFVGVLAGAAGSVLVWLPDWLSKLHISAVESDRMVFLLGAVLSIILLLVTLPLRDTAKGVRGSAWRSSSTGSSDPVGSGDSASNSHPAANSNPGGRRDSPIGTGQLIGRLSVTNALNGFGFGFLGPMLTYWFHVHFGVGVGKLAVMYVIVNLVSALPYLGAWRLARRLGAVLAVTVTRAGSIAALLAMAWVPSFTWAAALFALRMALNSLGVPARQSYVMGVADSRHRGKVAAISALPSQLSSSASPAIGGALMAYIADAPIFGAVVFMTANLITYYLAFRNVPPPEEATPSPSANYQEQKVP